MSNKENQSELGVEEMKARCHTCDRLVSVTFIEGDWRAAQHDRSVDDGLKRPRPRMVPCGGSGQILVPTMLPSPPVERTQDEPKFSGFMCTGCGEGKLGCKEFGCWKDGLTNEQRATPEPAAGSEEPRPYPTGGDPKDFCTCKHHEMCHASYVGMNRACNQTGCGCREYTPEVAPVASQAPPIKAPQGYCDNDHAIGPVAHERSPSCIDWRPDLMASQAPPPESAPKRPIIIVNTGNTKMIFAVAAFAYMDYLEGHVRELEAQIVWANGLLINATRLLENGTKANVALWNKQRAEYFEANHE